MIQSLDFGKWLDRLGLKTQAQPPVIQSAQPVLIVGDHRRLVSWPLLCSYIVGASEPPDAAQVVTVVVGTPVPLRVVLQVGTQPVTIEIGAGPAPAVNSGTVLVPQLFTPTRPAQARWISGDSVGLASFLLPSLNAGATSNATINVFVPAGGFMRITGTSLGGQLRWAAIVDELPNELAQ